jgi:hypothetical protein
MSKLNQEQAYITSAVGGSLSRVSFEGNEGRSTIATVYGGGIRGKIKGFSEASRRNLLGRMASINRTAFRAYEGRLISLGLTYPHEWPEDAEACKKHLKAFASVLQGRTGPSLLSEGWGYSRGEPGISTFSSSCLLPSDR